MQVLYDRGNGLMQELAQRLVQPEIVLEHLLPPAAQVEHATLRTVVVLPQVGQRIVRQMERHA